jgi:hypothetical protein
MTVAKVPALSKSRLRRLYIHHSGQNKENAKTKESFFTFTAASCDFSFI